MLVDVLTHNHRPRAGSIRAFCLGMRGQRSPGWHSRWVLSSLRGLRGYLLPPYLPLVSPATLMTLAVVPIPSSLTRKPWVVLRSNWTDPCHILISEFFITQVLCHMRLHIPGSVSWDLDIQGSATVLDTRGMPPSWIFRRTPPSWISRGMPSSN